MNFFSPLHRIQDSVQHCTMNQYIIYNAIYHVLICRQCGCSIPQDWIMRHFRQYHKTIPLEVRQEIINYGSGLDLWQPIDVHKQREIMNIKSSVEGLTILSGFQCQEAGCIKYTHVEKSMKIHYRTSHAWTAKDGVKWRTQRIQSFFGGPHVRYDYFWNTSNFRYFAVEGNEEPQNVQWLDVLWDAKVLEAEEQEKVHNTTLNYVKDSQSLVTKTPWLRHTRWEETFMGKDMSILVKLTEGPRRHDHQERRVWDATARVIRACFNGVMNCQERGWTLIPFWLRSVDRNKEDTKSFRMFIAPATLYRYVSYWQQYILFSLRAMIAEESVQFNARQREALLELNLLLNEINETTDDTEIDKKILQLSILLIQHSDYAKERSSLIYFTGVLGYNIEWKQWRQPSEYTTILAGIQFCIRVIMLDSALPKDIRDEINESSPENPVQMFRKVRDQWLVDGEGIILSVISNNSGTPFGYIHRLLNYGMIAKKNMTTRSRIRWSADKSTLYFDGRALKMNEWKEFANELISSAEEILSHRLLFLEDGSLPEVDLNVVDDPSNHEGGHYFVLDEADAWKKGWRAVIKNLRKSEHLEKVVEVHGDEIEFLKAGVDEYEADDTKFRELLAIIMMITCGLSGRGSEMTSLQYINTMEGDRSIYIEDGQMMFITEYHKSMALTDEVKVCNCLRDMSNMR